MARRRLIMVVMLAANAASASPRDNRLDWDYGYQYGGGVMEAGDMTFVEGALSFTVARRITGPLSLYTVGEAFSLSHDEVKGIGVHGIAALDAELNHDPYTSFPMVAHVLAGLGVELDMWDRGTLTRPIAITGFEFVEGFMNTDSDGFLRGFGRMGARMGVRVQVAPGVERTTLARVCSGCATMQPSSAPLDLGVVGYFGLDFGR